MFVQIYTPSWSRTFPFEVLTFKPGLPFYANDPSFSDALVFLDPVTLTAEGPSCVSGQGEARIPQMTLAR